MGSLHLAAFLSGFGLGISLIAAIGAQNAFILRQGLMRAHVFVLCLICALADAALIAAGVAGLGTLVAQSETLILAVTVGGAAFLLGYAALAFRRALNPGSLQAARTGEHDLGKAVMACLAFTFLNPHVYLDTVVLLGGLSAGFEGQARLAFGGGRWPPPSPGSSRSATARVCSRRFSQGPVRGACWTRPSARSW